MMGNIEHDKVGIAKEYNGSIKKSYQVTKSDMSRLVMLRANFVLFASLTNTVPVAIAIALIQEYES